MTDENTHFGFQSVPLGEKQGQVNEVFRSVASRYDLMNDLMSAGLHRLWKDALVSTLRPPRDRPFRHLDVAGGTGDVAFRILDGGGPQTRVTVLDINGEMLKVGAERAGHRYEGRIDFVEANAEELPFESQDLRRLHHRLRHPQRAAHRRGASRGAPGAQTRRTLPVPRILEGRRAGARQDLRRLFLQRHPDARAAW